MRVAILGHIPALPNSSMRVAILGQIPSLPNSSMRVAILGHIPALLNSKMRVAILGQVPASVNSALRIASNGPDCCRGSRYKGVLCDGWPLCYIESGGLSPCGFEMPVTRTTVLKELQIRSR